MKCELVQGTLAAWDPVDDLPDEMVGHLDDCTVCRSVFDGRFVPVLVHAAAPAPQRRPIPWWPVAGVALVAAAWLLTVTSLRSPPPDLAWSEPQVCQLDPWQPPECPPV